MENHIKMRTTSEKLTLFMTGLAGGGAERVMLTLAEGFADMGYEVDLVVTKATGTLVKEVPSNVKLVDLKAPRIIASLPALTSYLRREKPMAILSAMKPANCVAVWAKVFSKVPTRLVLSEHSILSVPTKRSDSLKDHILPLIMKKTYSKADLVIAVSNGV